MSKNQDGERMRKLRWKLHLKQGEFWPRVGVTQSAGSRYETGGRRLPEPLKKLIDLAYGNKPLEALNRLRG